MKWLLIVLSVGCSPTIPDQGCYPTVTQFMSFRVVSEEACNYLGKKADAYTCVCLAPADECSDD